MTLNIDCFFIIFSVSAISLNIPEYQQQWYASSKALEQNQTAISQKISEIQQKIDAFEREVSYRRTDKLVHPFLIASHFTYIFQDFANQGDDS